MSDSCSFYVGLLQHLKMPLFPASLLVKSGLLTCIFAKIFRGAPPPSPPPGAPPLDPVGGCAPEPPRELGASRRVRSLLASLASCPPPLKNPGYGPESHTTHTNYRSQTHIFKQLLSSYRRLISDELLQSCKDKLKDRKIVRLNSLCFAFRL